MAANAHALIHLPVRHWVFCSVCYIIFDSSYRLLTWQIADKPTRDQSSRGLVNAHTATC